MDSPTWAASRCQHLRKDSLGCTFLGCGAGWVPGFHGGEPSTHSDQLQCLRILKATNASSNSLRVMEPQGAQAANQTTGNRKTEKTEGFWIQPFVVKGCEGSQVWSLQWS